MPELTDKERELIKQLRAKVSGVLTDEYLLGDGNLYKWLEYKNNKVDKAEKAILKNIQWRKDNNIDNILHEDFGDFWNSITYNTDGIDKKGRPVITSYVAQVDSKEALDVYLADQDKAERFALKMAEILFEIVKKKSKETDGKVDTVLSVVDDRDLKLKPIMSKIIELVPRAGGFTKILERNYPGLVDKIYVINAPKKITTLFTMLKPFLKATTVKRIKIFSKKAEGKEEKWRDVILAEVDADQLRQRYGGTRPDDQLPPKVIK